MNRYDIILEKPVPKTPEKTSEGAWKYENALEPGKVRPGCGRCGETRLETRVGRGVSFTTCHVCGYSEPSIDHIRRNLRICE